MVKNILYGTFTNEIRISVCIYIIMCAFSRKPWLPKVPNHDHLGGLDYYSACELELE